MDTITTLPLTRLLRYPPALCVLGRLSSNVHVHTRYFVVVCCAIARDTHNVGETDHLV